MALVYKFKMISFKQVDRYLEFHLKNLFTANLTDELSWKRTNVRYGISETVSMKALEESCLEKFQQVYKFKCVTRATLQEYIEFHFKYLFNDCLAAIFTYNVKLQRRLDIEQNLVVRIFRDNSQALYNVPDDEFAMCVNKILGKTRGRFLKKMNRNPLKFRLAHIPDVKVCYEIDQ